MIHRPVRTPKLLLAAVTTLALSISLLGTSPAHADEIVVPPGSTLITQSQPDTAAPGSLAVQIYLAPTNVVLVDNPGGAIPVAPQCVNVPDVSTCTGSSNQVDYGSGNPPITVGNTVQGQSVYGGLPEKAISWIQEEAIDVLQSIGGVEGDGMVRSYAEPEIRAYMYTRIFDILDKKLYGEPMSVQEQITYSALMELLKAREVAKAKQVLEEYERWESNPCTYPVPRAPASNLTSPPNLIAGTQKCRQNANPYVDASSFLKNTPEVESFESWAAFRNPSPLMTEADNPVFKGMTASTIVAIGYLGAIALAAAAGAAAFFIGAAVLSFGTAAAILTAAGAATTSITALSAAGMSGAVIGAAAASIAGIILVVVLAIAATGVSIWAIEKEASIGRTIRKRAVDAAKDDDPLGIVANQPAYAALDYTTRQAPAQNPALHTQTAFHSQLLGMIEEWTMLSPQGTFVPDTNSGYGSPASGPTDTKFLLNGVPTDTVTVRAPDGTIDWTGTAVSGYRVHFSRGWLMVSPFKNGAYQPAKPSLSLSYVKQDGSPGLMSVLRGVNGDGEIERQFSLTSLVNDKHVSTTSETWTFRGSGATVTTAALQNKVPVLPALSLVPTARGRMTPGGVLTFQANVSEPGLGLPGTYSWVIDRLGDNGTTVQSWTEGNLVGFQRRFDQPGSYRARVRFQGTRNGTPFDISGTVPFTIGSPVPQLFSSALGEPRLRDDLVTGNRLSLDLRMMQDTPSNAVTPEMLDVEVEWADDRKGHRVVENYRVKCMPVGDGTCETGVLNQPLAAPLNPQWSASPSYRIPDDQAFLPYVTVKVTNAYGATVRRAFQMPGEHRPRFADSSPTVEMPVGVSTRVRVSEVVPSALVPPPVQAGIDLVTIQPFLTKIQSHLPEGVQAEMVKDGGKYYVELFGSPSADDIGPRTFPLPAEQEPRGSGLLAAPALVTLSVVSSLAPGYRAVLRGVPTFSQRSYRTAWPAWYTQVPVRSTLTTDPPFTGTVMCKLVRFGQVVFDKECAQDQKFPWPATLTDGDYEASVRAVSNGQTVVAAPYAVGFHASFLQPSVALDRAVGTARTQTLRLSVQDGASGLPGSQVTTPFSAHGYKVFCRVNGAAERACLDGGSLAVARTLGRHTVVVRVVAPDGAAASRTAVFTVPAVTTTARTVAAFVKSTRRVNATTRVRDQFGQAVTGRVQFVLKRGVRTVGSYRTSLNRLGVAKPVFAKQRKKGLYTVIATYQGAGLWRASTSRASVRVR